MNLPKSWSKILHPIAVLSVAFIICFSLPSHHACCEETHAVTAQQVDEILKQVDIEKGEESLEACKKLYSMGPEIDPLLLQKLREIDIMKANKPHRTSTTIASILASRGYEKDVFEILKKRLRSKDSGDRLSGAIMFATCYRYYAVRDLAGIVTGEKAPSYLSEKAVYEWKATSQEVVEQILNVMKGKSDISKRSAISFLEDHGLKCPECKYDAAKWESFLKQNKYVQYLGSDWLENRKLSGGEIAGVMDLTASLDGAKITFDWRYISAGKYNNDIWIMDTLNNTIIKVKIPGSNPGLSWSPDGARILFINIATKGLNVCTITEDGSEFCIWTNSFLSSNDSKVEWSGDSSKIAFVKMWFMPEAHEIWVTDLKKNSNARLVKDNYCFSQHIRYKVYPIWFISKNDKIFLWDCYGKDKASFGIYSVPLNVPEKEELVQAFDWDDLQVESLFPSPDETKVAFTKGDGRLFIHDFVRKEAKEYTLAESNYLSGFFQWTPDGNAIVFSKDNSAKKSEIYILSVKTGELIKLANGFFEGKAFGPGGKSIYYLQHDPHAKHNSIWRVNLDGTDNTKIFPANGTEYTSVQPTPILKWAERN